jgi:preprotein translocase subunit SecA
MYKYKLNKYLKKINQINQLNQFSGEINPDFKMFESCIGKIRKASDSPTIKIRSREELLQYLIDKKSIVDLEAKIISEQLRIIDEYIKDGERTINKSKINPSDPRLGTFDEVILREIAKIALMVCKINGQYPRDNQLIAVLQFLEGKNILLQAGTGQGKSLIVAMIAILQKRIKVPYNGNDQRPMAVHVITVTNDLATDGRESNKALFDAYGFKARGIHDQGNIDDIIYGTPYDFEAQALNEASDPSVPKQLLNNAVRRTIILDESDSHLVDNAGGRVMTSDQDPSAQIVKDVLIYIANETSKFFTQFTNYPILTGVKAITELGDDYVTKKYPNFVNRWNSEKKVWVLNAFKIFNPNSDYKPGVNFIMVKSLYAEIIDFGKYNPQINVKPLIDIINIFYSNYNNPTILTKFKNEISKWSIKEDDLPSESKSTYNRIIELISLIRLKNKEQVYGIVFMGAIQYLDIGTGQIISNMRFSNGIQEFLEYKYFKAIFTEPTISVRSYSLYRYIRESELIFGLSGTVGLDKDTLDFQRKVWKIDKSPVILPEFAVPQLVEIKPSIHVDKIEEWHGEILKEIRLRNKEQPVLIITENPDRARDVYNYLKTQSLNPSIYEASSDKHILEEKLGPNRIIITTNLGGRGSDYQYNSKLSPKGLHVIVGFNSDEERILAQARGRAGRAGNPGSWRKISFGSILRQKPDLDNIKKGVRNTIGEDVIFEIYLFIKDIIKNESGNKNILESRLTYLMSWLSKPDIRELLLNNITAKYNSKDDSVNYVLSAFILEKWSKDENPKSTVYYNEKSLDSIKLSLRLKPHLVELKRLN